MNMLMGIFLAGVNLQGLIVSIAVPIVLGGPLTFFFLLKHEQLRQANRQLEHLATTDWLTGCLNRGEFTRMVALYLGQSANGGRNPGALLVIDADDFKGVNDRFGHDCGDDALRQIAAAIRSATTSKDIVGRLGGEEFGIFIANASSATADRIAEQVRSAVAARSTPAVSSRTATTSSSTTRATVHH